MPSSADQPDRSGGESPFHAWRRVSNGVDLGPGAPIPWAFPHPAIAAPSAVRPDSLSVEAFSSREPGVRAESAPHPTRRLSRHLGILALVAGFAIAVWWGIGSFGLWRDEAFSVSTSNRSWAALAKLSVTKETNGVLYAVLLKLWTIFGTSETALRALSAIAMVAAVALTYVLAVRLARHAGLAGVRVGLVAAGLTAVNGTILEYAQEVRFYSVVCVVVLAAMLAFEAEVRAPTRRSLLLWSAALVVVPLVHLMAVVVVPAQLLAILAVPRPDRHWARRARALIPVVVVTLPLAALIASRDEGQSLIRFGPAVAGELVQTLSGGSGALGALAVLIIAALFLRAGQRDAVPVLRSGRLRSGRLRRIGVPGGVGFAYALVLAWAVVPVALLAAASVLQPVLAGRYVIHLIPAMGIAAGLGIAALGPPARRSPPGAVRPARAAAQRRVGGRSLGAGFVSSVVVAAVLFASAGLGAVRWLRHGVVDDWRGTYALVQEHAHADDGVVFANDSVRLFFEYYRARASNLVPGAGPQPVFPPGAWGTFSTGDHSYRAFTTAEIAAAEGKVGRLWVVVERPLAEHVPALAELRARHCRIQRWDVGSAAVVELYEFGPLSGGPCPSTERVVP